MNIRFGSRAIDLSSPRVMGILNITPDSFYDGGRFVDTSGGLALDRAIIEAESMMLAGADFIDVGGESTRPGADKVSEQQELDRVIPVVDAICRRLDVVVSVDTSRPKVMTEAAALGAGLINDVRALQVEGALGAASKASIPVCLMHMQGSPLTMQENPCYEDVLSEVNHFLFACVDRCLAAGIEENNIILDPGFGFGKTDSHNVELLQQLDKVASGKVGEAKDVRLPILAGLSRKSLIGRLLARDLDDRLAGSLTMAILAAQKGASILRVHDVQATVDALKLLKIINGTNNV